jgi:hypothetical protein
MLNSVPIASRTSPNTTVTSRPVKLKTHFNGYKIRLIVLPPDHFESILYTFEGQLGLQESAAHQAPCAAATNP